jgi:hypothetical protein
MTQHADTPDASILRERPPIARQIIEHAAVVVDERRQAYGPPAVVMAAR